MESDSLTESSENYEVVTAQVKPFGLSRFGTFNNGSSVCPLDAIPSLPAYFSGMYTFFFLINLNMKYVTPHNVFISIKYHIFSLI